MRRTPLLFLPLAILLAGCAGPSGGYQRVDGGSDAWGVGVTDPRANSLGDCHEDPSGVGVTLISRPYDVVSINASRALRSSDEIVKSTSAFSIMRPGVVVFGSGRMFFSSR